MGWGGRILLGLALVLLGAIAAAWGLARSEQAARLFGVASAPAPVPVEPGSAQPPQQLLPPQPASEPAGQAGEVRIDALEERVSEVEDAARQVEGSAGRADALLVAFAARRAIDRGVALGYLEPLLLDRFGRDYARATNVIISSSRAPVRLSDLQSEFEALEPVLASPAPGGGVWTDLKREARNLITVRRSDRPSTRPGARYARALDRLRQGEVDKALAETMRLPSAAQAGPWIRKARRYVATQQALDEIESAALVGRMARPGA